MKENAVATIEEKPGSIRTFGDSRKIILETIQDLRNGKMPVQRAMAIAANMKVLNDNIQAEINLAKVTLLVEEKGHNFGRMVKMGKNTI